MFQLPVLLENWDLLLFRRRSWLLFRYTIQNDCILKKKERKKKMKRGYGKEEYCDKQV